MKFGALVFPTADTLQPPEFGRALEERGFESVWLSEHSHIPTSRLSPFGGRDPAPPLPAFYGQLYDSYLSLTAIAAVTTTLRLATGIALVAQRDPIWMAKQVATLDHLSNGRAIVGIGYGWNKEELADHGVAYGERRAVLRERVLAMQRLWADEVAEFDGEYVNFEPSWSWPKPLQRPAPPIVLGSGPGPKTFAHVIEFCAGWMPNFGRYDIENGLALLRRMCDEADRQFESIELGITGVPREPAHVEQLIDDGFSRCVFTFRPESPDDVMRDLDVCASVISKFS